MSPKKTGRFMAHARELRRHKAISNQALLVLDSLVWDCGRLPFADEVIASYRAIQASTRLRAAVVADALAELVEAGLLIKHKRWAMRVWSKGKQFVRLATRYRFVPAPHCDSACRNRRRETGLELKKAFAGLQRRLAPREPVRTVEQQLEMLRCLEKAKGQ